MLLTTDKSDLLWQMATTAKRWHTHEVTGCLLPWLFAVAAAELVATALQQQQCCLLVAAVLLPLACRLGEACCYY
jgi:hypothetical protein